MITNATLAQKVNDVIADFELLQDDMQAWMFGVVGGGPNTDGRFVIRDFQGNMTLATSPLQLEDDVNNLTTGVAANATAAVNAQAAAEAARDTADTHRSDAVIAENSSISAKDTATLRAAEAATDAATALAQAANALTSATTSAADAIATAADAVQTGIDAAAAAASAAAAAGFDPVLFAKLADPETITGAWLFTAAPVIAIPGGGGERLVLKDSDSTGNSANNFIAFKDMNNTRQGWLGFGSSTNDDLSVSTDGAFGDIILNPRGSNALRISNSLATFGVGLNITGAITLSGDINALSYEGILGFNLIDKTAASVLIAGAWRFTDEDLLLSNNIALTSIDPGGPVRNLIKIAATTGEVIVGDALNPMDLRATLVDIQAPVTAVSYDGILAANLLDKAAAETVIGAWVFSDLITLANDKRIQGLSTGGFARHIARIDTADRLLIGSTDANTRITAQTSIALDRPVDVTGALTATSYDGVLAANLLDKASAETITDIWSFIRGGGGAKDMMLWRDSLDTQDLMLHYDGDNFEFRSAGSGGGSLYMQFSAIDGTMDFGGAPTKSSLGIPYYITSGYTGGKISASATTPSGPVKGDIWFDIS